MAFHARDRLVCPAQREARKIVVECLEVDGLEERFVVTGEAGLTETTLVLVLVARHARRREAKERRIASGVDLVVALGARRGFVRAVERPARQRVIELAPIAAWPPHQRRSAEMLTVATLARPAPVLQPVQPLAGVDARTQIAVAPEAPRLIDAPAGAMAFAAVLVAVYRCVRLR
jgi:hypothetical protein